MSAPPWRIGNDLNPQRRDARVPPRLGGESTCAWVCVRFTGGGASVRAWRIALVVRTIQLLRRGVPRRKPNQGSPRAFCHVLLCAALARPMVRGKGTAHHATGRRNANTVAAGRRDSGS